MKPIRRASIHPPGVLSAYKLLLEGKSPAFLEKQKFSEAVIKKALNFRDNYQHRDMLKAQIAKESKISKETITEMVRAFESHRERMIK